MPAAEHESLRPARSGRSRAPVSCVRHSFTWSIVKKVFWRFAKRSFENMRSQTGVWERVDPLDCDAASSSVRDAAKQSSGYPSDQSMRLLSGQFFGPAASAEARSLEEPSQPFRHRAPIHRRTDGSAKGFGSHPIERLSLPIRFNRPGIGWLNQRSSTVCCHSPSLPDRPKSHVEMGVCQIHADQFTPAQLLS